MTNVDNILTARQKTHGSFDEGAYCVQTIKEFLRSQKGWQNLNPGQAEALDMVVHKIGRIMAGNPDIHDHWDDIAGYATLASKTFKEEQ